MANLPGKQMVVKTDHGSSEGLDIGLRHVLDRGVRLNLVAPGVFPIPESLVDAQTGEQHIRGSLDYCLLQFGLPLSTR